MVLAFSWDNCNIQEKLQTVVMQNFGGYVNKKYNSLCLCMSLPGEIADLLFSPMGHQISQIK